jgi:hypothetical protein
VFGTVDALQRSLELGEMAPRMAGFVSETTKDADAFGDEAVPRESANGASLRKLDDEVEAVRIGAAPMTAVCVDLVAPKTKLVVQ